jgi:DNA (cytosine-5)-methyltransferase 1
MVAVNHWPRAIKTHTTNHPDAIHYCEDVLAIDPLKAVPGGYVFLLWASVECIFHSNARGGKPMQDQSRSSAWDLLKWVQKLHVDNICVENIPEFVNWGPLGANGRPIKSRKGETFRAWVRCLRALGYTVDWRVLNAADFGDATSRRRLFVQARRGRCKITWPTPTHFPPADIEKARTIVPDAKPWRTAREIINWDLKGESIYTRKKPLSPKTMQRIIAGLVKYSGLPFIVPGFGDRAGQTPRTHSIDGPIPTVTASGWHGLVSPFLVGAGGPTGQGRPQSVDNPLGTVLTNDHRAIVTPFLVVLQNNRDAIDLDRPLPTVLTSGAHFGKCEPYIVPVTHQGGHDRVFPADRPLPTITTAHRGELACVSPEVRSLCWELPPFEEWMAKTEGLGGTREEYDRLCEHKELDRVRLNEYLVKYYEGSTAATVDAPLPAVTANYEHLAVAQPFVVVYHSEKPGTKRRTSDLGAPVPTIDCSNRFALVEPFLVPYYGKSAAASVDDPLDTVTTRDTFALVSPEFAPLFDKGQIVGWLDILFRMLTWEELAAAQSYQHYTFTGTREEKVKQIGNGVPKCLAEAICYEIMSAGIKRRGSRKSAVSGPVIEFSMIDTSGDLFAGSEATR